MKKWYYSKTHWFNIAIVVTSFLTLNLPLLQTYIGEYYNMILFAVGLIGLVLRQTTTTSIEKVTKLR